MGLSYAIRPIHVLDQRCLAKISVYSHGFSLILAQGNGNPFSGMLRFVQSDRLARTLFPA